MKKLGFGAMRLPVFMEGDQKVIDIEQVKEMVDTYLAAGYNYFDTAYMYHDMKSEGALKTALVDRYPREKFLLADKMPAAYVKGPEDYPRFFEEQLERTGAGYFDYYLLHNMGTDRYAQTKEFGGFEFLRQKKAEGLIKKMGFSFHDGADALDLILTENPDVDFVQLQLNYLDWTDPVVQSGRCYEVAAKHNKPVIVMEPVKGGTLANLPAEAEEILKEYAPDATPVSYALRFAATQEHVMMTLSGMSSICQLKENIDTFETMKPLTDEEKVLLEEACKSIRKNIEIPCTACNYCMEVCPQHIPISVYFGVYNDYKSSGEYSKMYFNRAAYGRGKASECVNCHRCEKNCPQHIAIPEYLKKVAELEER